MTQENTKEIGCMADVENKDSASIQRLIDAAENGQLVVIIGAGVSKGLTSGKLPLWKEMIDSGLTYAVTRGCISEDQAHAPRAQLNSTSMDDLLNSAEFVGEKLGAPSGIHYGRWLQDHFQNAKVTNQKLRDAILALHARKIPICTLNYDHLLENITGLQTILASDTAKFAAWFRRERDGILHLHGSYESPESCVLGVRDYENTLNDDVRNLFQRGLATFKKLLFIGCGETLADPNLSSLITWIRNNINLAAPVHYALTLDDDVANRYIDPAWSGFVEPIGYGKTHGDLAGYLLKLFPVSTKEIEFFDNTFPAGLIQKNDPRLYPREQIVIGRENELMQVISFLNSDSPTAYITGSGGIGKTEICKAALKSWIEIGNDSPVYWIQLSDAANSTQLLSSIGAAIGLSSNTIEKIESLSCLSSYMPSGLYYLDNLEGIVESDNGVELLRSLSLLPKIRVLGSSRVSLDGMLGKDIIVDRLDKESSFQLFKRCWAGAELDDVNECVDFVDKQLGGHPLSIILVARLGRAYSWSRLVTLWDERGTSIAKTRIPGGRLDSLDISFALTATHLKDTPGALELWQFVALFSQGVDEIIMELWSHASGCDETHIALIEHHLLSLKNEHFTMLPPISRYALDKAGDNLFPWISARKIAYKYFISLLGNYFEGISQEEKIKLRGRISKQISAINQLIMVDSSNGSAEIESIKVISNLIPHIYSTNFLDSRNLAETINKVLNDGLSFNKLGDLERMLGNEHKAKDLYDRAVFEYQKEKNILGIASVSQSIGDFESQLGHWESSRKFLNNAIDIYGKNEVSLGIANAKRSLGDMEKRLGRLQEANTLFDEARDIFEREKDEKGVANTLKALGELHHKLNNFPLAREYLEKAISLYKKHNNNHGLANALKSLGHLEKKLHNWDDARACYTEAITLHQAEHDKHGIALSFESLGKLEERVGNRQLAVENYIKAINLYSNKIDPIYLADALTLLGNAECVLGDLISAEEHFNAAVDIYRRVANNKGLLEVLHCLGQLKINFGDKEAAYRYYEESLSLSRIEQSSSGTVAALSSLGDIFIYDGDLLKARKYIEEALVIQENRIDRANVLSRLGNLEKKSKNYPAAKENYLEAIDIYKSEDAFLGLSNAYQGIGDVFLALSEFEQALNYYDLANDIYFKENNFSGLSNTLCEVIRCYLKPGFLSQEHFVELGGEALFYANQSGSQAVVQYVHTTVREVSRGNELLYHHLLSDLQRRIAAHN